MAGHFPFCLAVVAVACLSMAGWSLAAALVLAAGLAGLCGWWIDWKHGCWVLVIGMVATLNLEIRTRMSDSAQFALFDQGPCEITARLTADAQGSDRSWRAEAALLSDFQRGAMIEWHGSGPPPVAGTRLTANGDFSLPKPARNPGVFDRALWMRQKGIAAVFTPLETPRIEVPSWARLSGSLRGGFADAVVAGLDAGSPGAQIIQAMVIGKRPRDADSLTRDFRNSGALHVFCVSGLHVTMVGGIVWLVLGRFGLRRRQVIVLLVPVMFGYAWLTGYEAPAARAAWMGTAFLGAFVLRRKPNLLNALGVVLLLNVLWDGRVLFQPGVQLSYGVVAVIALAIGPASRWFRWIAKTESYLPPSERGRARIYFDKARAWIASSLAVSLAAGVGSAPLTMFHFGIVTPISLASNLLLLPLVGVILAFALTSSLFYPFAPAVSVSINRVNASIAGGAAYVAAELARVPWGHFTTRSPGRAKLLVHDLPYGAMSSVFTGDDGEAVLYDCGGSNSFHWSVLPSLRHQGIEPDTVILSHPDGSHLGGGYPVWQMLPIRRAILPVKVAQSHAFKAWDQKARYTGVQVWQARKGDRIPSPDGAIWQCIHVSPHESSTALADDRVAVWRLDWKGWSFLFLADAGYRTERAVLDSAADLAADVIVVGKHRRDLSLSEDFLTEIKPRIIVGKNPKYPPEEHYPRVIVESWKSLGIDFIDQQSTGAVTVTVQPDGSLRFTGFLTPEEPLVMSKR